MSPMTASTARTKGDAGAASSFCPFAPVESVLVVKGQHWGASALPDGGDIDLARVLQLSESD